MGKLCIRKLGERWAVIWPDGTIHSVFGTEAEAARQFNRLVGTRG